MANGQTIVTYGNWRLAHCQTLKFDTQPVKDELSNTDLMFYRYTVRVLGYITALPTCDRSRPLAPAFYSAGLNHCAQRVSLPPRQRFEYIDGADAAGSNGVSVLVAFPHPGPTAEGVSHLDLNNGPVCTDFIVTHIAADNVWRVEAEFVICKLECAFTPAQASGYTETDATLYPGSATGKTNAVLSNRWSCVDSLDANLRTTRTYQGRLRVSSNNIDPNQFRFYVVPPVQPGLRRQGMQFAVTTDGLNLDYTIQDIEVAYAAPYPAKTWNVRHTETTGEAMLGIGEIEIMLTGDRYVVKNDLIILAMKIIDAKLLGVVDGVAANPQGDFLEQLSITDITGDEISVSVNARVRHLPADKPQKEGEPIAPPDFDFYWRLSIRNMLRDVSASTFSQIDADYDVRFSYGGREDEVPPYQGAVSLLGMVLPYLQSPCNNLHKIVPDGAAIAEDENEDSNAEPKVSITARVTESLEDLELNYSDSTKTNIYAFYQMESLYKTHQKKLGLPIANTSYAASGESTRYVTLSQPQSRQVVRVTAERVEEFPEMPSGEQLRSTLDSLGTSPGELPGGVPMLQRVFLGVKQGLATPFYNAGGQKMWRVANEYFFGLNRAPLATEKLAIGKTKWTTDAAHATNTTATEGW